MSSSEFKVIIVGGGVSGLTLANALERSGIDYVLLESRNSIAPVVGASIAITANGGRILDQLKCYEQITENTIPMDVIRTWHNGKLLRESDGPELNHKRSGYPFVFMDRHFLLATLYSGIEEKRRVVLNKKVSKVEHTLKGVSVECTDGSAYHGAIVVGADGVYSIVRNEMWRNIDIARPGFLSDTLRSAMYAEYQCMFGVSKATTGLDHGSFNQVLGENISFLHSLDKSGRVFWFVFAKMAKKYHVPNIPRFSDEDAQVLAQRCMSVKMTDQVSFADLWQNRLSYRLVPLEEAWYEQWTWGRFICIGDAIHKWTPNIGQGGNNAIETAAAAANAIYDLRKAKFPPSHSEIEQKLSEVSRRRKPRAKATFDIAILVTRLEALKSSKEKFLMFRLMPLLGEWLVNQIALGIVGSEKLKYLPDTLRSFRATMAFNPGYETGTTSNILRRAVQAAPLLTLGYFANSVFSLILSQSTLHAQVETFLSSGRITFDDSSWNLPTRQWPLSLLLITFSPSLLDIDTSQRYQMISFLADLGPLWLIWIFESHRRANSFKFVTFPILFGMAFQMVGIGIVGPVWFFLHFVQSPIEDFAALDWRLVNVAAAKTSLLAVLATFTIPSFAMYLLPSFHSRLVVNTLWQIFPLTSSIIHWVLRKLIVKDTTKHDRIHNVTADLSSIRLSIWVLATISTLTFNWIRFNSISSMWSLYFPGSDTIEMLTSPQKSLNLVDGIGLFLQIDQTVCFVAAFLWLVYLIRDLKMAGMTRVSWTRLCLLGICGLLFAGPGATVALTWLWREDILATKKPRGAVSLTSSG